MKKFFFYLIFAAAFLKTQAQEQFAVFFESNKFQLTDEQTANLNQWIAQNKTSKIVAINGFTDEDGTSGFNDTLAKKRLNFVFDFVKDQIKIREDFKSRSFGENQQISTVKAENRRVVIFYIAEKDLAREEEILGLKPKEIVPQEIIPIEEEAMNFPENATLLDKISLARPGTLILLKDINFYVNTFAVMPTSKREIDDLIYVLNQHPKLRIEIQGHICCVAKDVKNLSLERAKQIRRILVSEGIGQRRVTVAGFGVSRPKYPIPEKSEFEAARNRRVEIMIIEK